MLHQSLQTVMLLLTVALLISPQRCSCTRRTVSLSTLSWQVWTRTFLLVWQDTEIVQYGPSTGSAVKEDTQVNNAKPSNQSGWTWIQPDPKILDPVHPY